MKNKEIADILGISVNTVKALGNRAIQKMRVRMVILDMIEKGHSDDEIADLISGMDSQKSLAYLRDNYEEAYSPFEKPCYSLNETVNVTTEDLNPNITLWWSR